MDATPLCCSLHARGEQLMDDTRKQHRLMVKKIVPGRPFAGPLAVLLRGDNVHLAAVRNISVAGVGLVTSQRLEVGGELVAKLFTATREFLCARTVCVVHVTPRIDPCFDVGGLFDQPLSQEQLHALVANHARCGELSAYRAC